MKRKCNCEEHELACKGECDEVKSKKCFYYTNFEQDVFGADKKEIIIDKNFKYTHNNVFYKLASFVCYRLLMTPFTYIYGKIRFGLKIVGKKAVKNIKHGYFVYGNHTLPFGDTFIPSFINFPRKTFVLVNSKNISSFGKNFILLNGAIPLPDTTEAYKNFLAEIKNKLDKNQPIHIYPEAHLWPYYPKIRPFNEQSFAYPVKFNKPVFASTVTFQKRKHGKRPKVVVYVDGPFYPDDSLNKQEQKKALYEQVKNAMNERSKLNSCFSVQYIKKEET